MDRQAFQAQTPGRPGVYARTRSVADICSKSFLSKEFSRTGQMSLANAEAGEDAVEQVVGVHRTGQTAELVQRFPQGEGN